MKKGTLHMEMVRLWHTPRFLWSMFGLAVVCVASVCLEAGGQNVINVFSLIMDLNQFDLIVILFAAVPFSGAFFEEWKNGFSINVIGRGGREGYLCFCRGYCYNGVITFFYVDVFNNACS